jgi:DNA polymerase-3 subunit epsilon
MNGLREIVLDTESTGLDVKKGDRIIEIGGVELIDRVRTGRFYHCYVNPLREVSAGAFAVHGIATEFLADKPTFPQIAKEFLDFIGTSNLVIHNADFDIGFLNYQLGIIGMPTIDNNRVTDTLKLARRKYPGSPASLDALCKRYKICLKERTKHGALLDAELLAMVYVSLRGGRQNNIFNNMQSVDNTQQLADNLVAPKQIRPARQFSLSKEERDAHQEFLTKIKKPLWN